MARLPAFASADFRRLPGRLKAWVQSPHPLRNISLHDLAQRLRPSGRRLERARLHAAALMQLLKTQLRAEWAGSPPHRWLIARPAPDGLAATPAQLRPARTRRGKAIMSGRFVFDGLLLETGIGGDPWNRPAPSRAFAEALHGMEWLPDLLAVEGSAPTALILVQGWLNVFGRWNAFSWTGAVLERRVHNPACSLKPLLAEAVPSDGAEILGSLARQARHLMLDEGDETRRTERAAAAALAGAVLGGRAGESLMDRALRRLERTLPEAVLPDGGHASRSPEAGMELLLDLRVLDAALEQRGRPAPAELSRAIDRLAAALRRFVLADGRLVALQGGEEGDPPRIAAALGPEIEKDPPPVAQLMSAPHSGYEFLAGGHLRVVVDAGAPATGAWSASACAQPLAIEVTAGEERLITASAWSPRAPYAQHLRLTPAASTASVSDGSCGQPLQGRLSRILGFRLEGAPVEVRTRRFDGDTASWLELSHDGWLEAYGLVQERRLYMDRKADELRGEDQLVIRPRLGAPPPRRKRPVFLTVRLQLHPEVKASLALDHKSILLQPRAAKGGAGWWLRNDASEVSLEPAVRLADGRPHPTQQVVMRAMMGPGGQARIRWKLGHADKWSIMSPPAEDARR